MRPLAVLFTALLAFIFIPACSHQQVVQYPAYDVPAQIFELHADVDWSPRERHLIQTSMDNLNRQTRGLLFYTVAYDLDFNDDESLEAHRLDDKLIKISSESPPVAEFESVNQVKLLGMTMPSRDDMKLGAAIYLMYDRLDDARTFVSTAEHELLHLAGCDHTKDPRSLMYYAIHNGYPPICLHQADVEEICRHYGCEPERVGWCE